MHLQTCPITASKYIFQQRQQMYGDTGVTEVDRVTESIYSVDPGVDRHRLISISSYYIMNIHTLSFPTFGLTHSVQDFMDLRNCVDPQGQVQTTLPIRILPIRICTETVVYKNENFGPRLAISSQNLIANKNKCFIRILFSPVHPVPSTFL